MPLPVTRRPRRRKRRSSRSRPPKRTRPAKPGRGRPPKEGKAAPDKAKPPKPRDKSPKASPSRRSLPWIRAALPLVRRSRRSRLRPVTPPVPKKEEIVYLNLSDLHPFKNHPFGVRDDAEMQGLVESVKAAGVNQPALWCVPVRMAAMRSSQATAASGQASLPDLRICRVSSAT